MKKANIDWSQDLKCDHRVWPWSWPWPWIFKVKYGIGFISGKNGAIAMKRKANISIDLKTSNATIRFDLGQDLDLEFSRSNMELTISLPKIVRLPRNEKQTHRLKSRPQMWSSDLTLAMTLTLNFQGQIWNLLYLNQKWSDCHDTKSKHINLNSRPQIWPMDLTLAMTLIFEFSRSYVILTIWLGWVELWSFLWWATSAKRKDHHGVSSGWSSVWHRSNTGLSSTQYEQIPVILGVWPFWLTPFFFYTGTSGPSREFGSFQWLFGDAIPVYTQDLQPGASVGLNSHDEYDSTEGRHTRRASRSGNSYHLPERWLGDRLHHHRIILDMAEFLTDHVFPLDHKLQAGGIVTLSATVLRILQRVIHAPDLHILQDLQAGDLTLLWTSWPPISQKRQQKQLAFLTAKKMMVQRRRCPRHSMNYSDWLWLHLRDPSRSCQPGPRELPEHRYWTLVEDWLGVVDGPTIPVVHYGIDGKDHPGFERRGTCWEDYAFWSSQYWQFDFQASHCQASFSQGTLQVESA